MKIELLGSALAQLYPESRHSVARYFVSRPQHSEFCSISNQVRASLRAVHPGSDVISRVKRPIAIGHFCCRPGDILASAFRALQINICARSFAERQRPLTIEHT